MFEQLNINLADQWADTTLGNIVESSIFYRKVRLTTPVSRLSDLLSASPEAISLITQLIDDGHLEVEIEQFPAGELANDLRLLSAEGTDILRKPLKTANGEMPFIEEKDIREVMEEEYKLDFRLIDTLSFQALAKWGSENDQETFRSVERLSQKLLIPKVSDEAITSRLQRLREILEFGKDGLLQSLLDTGFGADGEIIHITGYKEKYGMNFPVIRTSNPINPASLLDAVSFAGFMMDNAKRTEFGDVFTSDRFNETMHNLYGSAISRLTGQSQVEVFQSTVLNTAPIKELFDDGEIDMSSLARALERKEELLKYTVDKPDEVSLTKWYFEQKNSDPLSGTTARKAVRFGVFSGAGMGLDLLLTGGLGTAAGVTLGIIDSFFLDRLANAGGPSTFVDGPLRKLVQPRT